MGLFAVGCIPSGHCHGKVTVSGRKGGRGVIFFVGAPLDVLQVHDCKMVCYERN